MTEYLLLDNKYWKVVLHPDQYYLGRSVIISKSTNKHLSQFSLEEMKELFEVIKTLEASLRKAFDATLFNWTSLNNDSYKQENIGKESNFHLHLRPRYSHPVIINGYTFQDRNFGEHYERHTDEQVSDEIMEEITKKIKMCL